jgi:autotransporter-associated beta strand protein
MVALALLTASLPSQAQLTYWTGAVDANWTTAGNWSGTVTSNTVVYDSPATANFTQSLNGNWFINGITIANPGGAITLNGNYNLTNSGGIDMSSATANLAVYVTNYLTANQTWTVGGSGSLTNGNITYLQGNTLTINATNTVGLAYGILKGPGALVKTGPGTLVTGSGTYANGTYILGGTLVCSGGNGLGNAWEPITINNATWDLGGRTDDVGPFTNINGTVISVGSTAPNFYNTITVSSGTSSITLPTGTFVFGNSGNAPGGHFVTPFNVLDGQLLLNVKNLGGGGGNPLPVNSLVKMGNGTLILSNVIGVTYLGTTSISNGVLQVYKLAVGGVDSGIGKSSSVATNLVIDGGTLMYSGPAVTCDRLFTAGTNNPTLDASGTGALNLSNLGAMGFDNSGPRTLTLTGTNSGINILSAAIGDNGGPTTVVKTGSGCWVLAGTNTYTGSTIFTNGTLLLGGPATYAGSSIAISNGMGFGLYNSATANLSDRISDRASVILDDGTFVFACDGSANSFSETVGPLISHSGTNNVIVGSPASGYTSVLTFASLTNSSNATINFQIANVGTTQVKLLTPPAPGTVFTLNGSSAVYSANGTIAIPGTIVGTSLTSFFYGGDMGQGLDLQGTNFEIAEYYGQTAADPIQIQNVTFSNNEGRTGGYANWGVDSFLPDFGATTDDLNAAYICNNWDEGDNDLDFGIPTTDQQQYKLQLIFHDGFWTAANERPMSLTIGSQTVVPDLDTASMGAAGSNALGVVISFQFTGNGALLPIQIHDLLTQSPANGPAILNALTLENVTGAQAPAFFMAPTNQSCILGRTITFNSLSRGSLPLYYQWYYAGTAMLGQTNASLTLTNVTGAAGGQYSVTATNSAGSATANCTLTVDSTKSVALNVVTGPNPGQGLNLDGNMVLAEYYGNSTGPSLLIRSTLFAPSARVAGAQSTQNTPNFGLSNDQVNLAQLSCHMVWGNVLSFSIPTTAGVQYRLQLIFHDDAFTAPGSRVFSVSAGGNTLVSDMDLVSLQAYTTLPQDIVLVYTFTGDGNPLSLYMPATINNALINALTLENVGTPASPNLLVTLPTNNAVVVGDSYHLSVLGAGGQLSYQWQKLVSGNYVNISDGGDIIGTTSNILTFASANVADAGSYRVIVSNSAGSTNSSASLSVLGTQPPSIIGHWLSGPANLTDSSGFAPAGIHDGTWYGDGSQAWSSDVPPNFSGASLDLTAGSAAVLVTNTAEADSSYVATFDELITNSFSVTVWIKGWPAAQWGTFVSKCGEAFDGGFELRRYSLSTNQAVLTVGGLSYVIATAIADTTQWHHLAAVKDGVAGTYAIYLDGVLAGIRTNDFSPMADSPTNHLLFGARQQNTSYGNYGQVKLFDVQIFDYPVTLTDIAGIMRFTNAPTIQSVKVSTAPAMAGQTVALTAVATGPALNYQWQKLVSGSYVNLSDGGNIAGATSNVLTVSNVALSDAGTYQVTVANSGGMVSSTAVLVVSLVPGFGWSMAAGQMTLNWTNGVLLASPALQGTNTVWVPVATNSPLVIPFAGTTGNMFYRVVSQ